MPKKKRTAKKSASPETVYTYRGGRKTPLKKREDQFVVRRLPHQLPMEMAGAEQVSSSSARVTCRPGALEDLMSEAREFAPTHHAYELAEAGTDFLISDRVIVSFKEALDEVAVGEFAGDYALELLEKISEKDYLFRLTDATGMNPVKLVVTLTEDDDRVDVADHDLNMIFRKSSLAMPTDDFYESQWHLHRRRTPSSDYDPRASAQIEAAWQLLDGFGGEEVVIAVTDDGCQLDHGDFDAPGKFAGWGYFQGISLVKRGDIGASESTMYQDGQDHGTACCGVIGAEIDGDLTVGAAAGCTLLPIKWPSSGASLFIGDTRMRRALEYLDSRVDVISNSWGSTPLSSWAFTTLNTIDTMVQSGGRRGRGVVFLWAAGNDNCPISHTATVDVPYTSGTEFFEDASGNVQLRWIGVETARQFTNDLAGRPGVMHVAALGSTAQRSHYSNYGTGIGICAPSSNSHTYRRLFLRGLGITTTEGRNNVTDRFGGTSSATPLVAAVAGLVISANPDLTALEVIQILKETASKDLDTTPWPRTPPASFDQDTGWDISPIAPFDDGAFADHQLPEGTWSPWFGHGRVDAHAAVARALALRGNLTSRIHVSRAANLTIPDNKAIGVVSRIEITEQGRIHSFKVSVNITHTWIGDLAVTLVGPTGQRAVLHNRAGNNADNIVGSYDEASTPALTMFHGIEAKGVWTLEVSDHAAADVGVLEEWEIEAEIQAPEELRLESTVAIVIPDNDPAGIRDTLSVVESRTVASVAVEVDISHSWRGDLILQLTGPSGDTATLHNREGRHEDNIQRIYQSSDTTDLARFVGQQANGDWTLKVADHAGADVGKLNRWALVLT